ncbi:MAG: hypothetical protein IPH62_19195 [Ignavibacteriae bacterium]|nr:hypothetical protein [Ignavibacteriota bacterium]
MKHNMNEINGVVELNATEISEINGGEFTTFMIGVYLGYKGMEALIDWLFG